MIFQSQVRIKTNQKIKNENETRRKTAIKRKIWDKGEQRINQIESLSKFLIDIQKTENVKIKLKKPKFKKSKTIIWKKTENVKIKLKKPKFKKSKTII